MIDVLLLLMAVIWGTNYSIVKHAFREIDPQAFNALRMSIASLIFLTVMSWCPCACIGPGRGQPPASVFYTPATMTGRDWLGARGARRSSATAAISTASSPACRERASRTAR